jgi:hypothetical protein
MEENLSRAVYTKLDIYVLIIHVLHSHTYFHSANILEQQFTNRHFSVTHILKAFYYLLLLYMTLIEYEKQSVTR